LYKFYSYKVMPFVASIFTKKYAYDYLPESIDMFPSRQEIKKTLEDNNFSNIDIIDMTFGISSIFSGQKNEK
jgi:demethylmenaquinone methyltransferase/2-methoxy-6-polyprenyl-1,4-benzoquinol methylase